MRAVYQAIRWIAIVLNLITTVAWGWMVWMVLAPTFLEGADFPKTVYVNWWVIGASLAPITALIAILWPAPVLSKG